MRLKCHECEVSVIVASAWQQLSRYGHLLLVVEGKGTGLFTAAVYRVLSEKESTF